MKRLKQILKELKVSVPAEHLYYPYLKTFGCDIRKRLMTRCILELQQQSTITNEEAGLALIRLEGISQ